MEQSPGKPVTQLVKNQARALTQGLGVLQGTAPSESFLAPVKMLNTLLPYDPAIPLLGSYPGEVGKAYPTQMTTADLLFSP